MSVSMNVTRLREPEVAVDDVDSEDGDDMRNSNGGTVEYLLR